MSGKKKTYVTAQEVDGVKGIKSPHARELEELGKANVDLFVSHKKRQIKILVENQLKGQIEDLGFDEDYTVTFEFFPEVRVHVLFYNYEEEEDEAFGGSEIKFLYSGDRVTWVPTEDSIGLIEATLHFLENLLRITPEVHGLSGKKTDLLEMAIEQRREPFDYLNLTHLDELAGFVGGSVEQKGDSWELTKTYFEGVTVGLIYNPHEKSLELTYEGENLIGIDNYARDQLGIFLMNHCLRFIRVTYPAIEMPQIVKQAFSFSYIKTHLTNDVKS
jgi:hypothetical protein